MQTDTNAVQTPAQRFRMTVLFTGNPVIEDAIFERQRHKRSYIEQYRLDPPDGVGLYASGWMGAIFRPGTNISGFDAGAHFIGIERERDLELYDVPAPVDRALVMNVNARDEAECYGFCQALCDLSGMTCHANTLDPEDDAYHHVRTLKPSKEPMPTEGFLALLLNIPKA